MVTSFNIKGLHHVTATVNDALKDYEFYTGLLGLRLVKKTVNFDNNQVYHFYYGNERGEPGTIFTTFPYKDQNIRPGEKGTGQVAVTNFSAPKNSFDFWIERLTHNHVECLDYEFFGYPTIKFDDPSGLELQIMFNDEDKRAPWADGPLDVSQAITGLHSVILSVADHKVDERVIKDTFGMKESSSQSNYIAYESSEGGVGNMMYVREDPHLGKGKNGIGTVHHVAWRIENKEQLDELRQYFLEELNLKPTEIKDRKYFQSVYVRIPGGVLFEVATVGPGFTVDEELNVLGEELKLPDWEEKNRDEIEAVLPSIR